MLTRFAWENSPWGKWMGLAVLLIIVGCSGRALAEHNVVFDPTVHVLGERQLGLGSWGADVFELQGQLTQLGYELTTDGLFGTDTHRAVVALQVANDLKPDGLVGPATLQVVTTLLTNSNDVAEYAVRPGDTLWGIARAYNTSMETLYNMNNLQSTVLQVGQVLKVPGPATLAQGTYTVQAGDTLSEIALRYQTTVADLMEHNDLTNPHALRVGATLKIPSQAGM